MSISDFPNKTFLYKNLKKKLKIKTFPKRLFNVFHADFLLSLHLHICVVGENRTKSAAIFDDGFSNSVDVRLHFSSAAPLSGSARRRPQVFLARGIHHYYIFERKNLLIHIHARISTNLLEFASTINHRTQKQKLRVNGVATRAACRLTSRRTAATTPRLSRLHR